MAQGIYWRDLDADFRERVKDAVSNTATSAQSCAVRASNELRNSALIVLRGSRSGRSYRRPGGGRRYTASAPGQPPAVRTGTLRMSWSISSVGEGKGHFVAGIYSDVPYANYLEEGTSKMAPRPFREAIIKKAEPRVRRIFNELKSK